MNESVFRIINDIGKEQTWLNSPLTWFSNWAVVLLALFMIVTFLLSVRNRSYKDAIIMISGGISFVVTFIICKLLGQLRYNEQPFAELENVNQLVFKEVNNSFPSDHTALFFSIMFAFYFYERKYKWLIVFPFLMALSRIYVGVHYPLDVLVAAIVGISISYMIVKLIKPNTLKLVKLLNNLVNKGAMKLKNKKGCA